VITVIPTCVDTERFLPLRGSLAPPSIRVGWRDRLVVVYTGAAGYWQHPESLVEFFSAVRQERADAAFLCLLRTGGEKMHRALDAAGLGEVSRVEEAVPLREIPRWLSQAAVGLVWYRPTFSRIGNFPTKLGEYLASGLPVIVGGATADSVEIVTRERVGVVVREFTQEAYREALGQVLALLKDPDIVSRCRRVAEGELSLRVGTERYRGIYRRLSERAR
jgi:glycosyltransferase involved in cell wall biosynthesis